MQLPHYGRRLRLEQRAKHGRERVGVVGPECPVGGVAEVFLRMELELTYGSSCNEKEVELEAGGKDGGQNWIRRKDGQFKNERPLLE
jgi:hypothetical protein